MPLLKHRWRSPPPFSSTLSDLRVSGQLPPSKVVTGSPLPPVDPALPRSPFQPRKPDVLHVPGAHARSPAIQVFVTRTPLGHCHSRFEHIVCHYCGLLSVLNYETQQTSRIKKHSSLYYTAGWDSCNMDLAEEMNTEAGKPSFPK